MWMGSSSQSKESPEAVSVGSCIMSTARAVFWLVFCSLVAAPRPGKSEPPSQEKRGAKKERPRVDQLGDPLPPGAIARLGSDRFLHDGWVASLALSHDG